MGTKKKLKTSSSCVDGALKWVEDGEGEHGNQCGYWLVFKG